MEKLQAMLDKAFGAPRTPREPERPSQGFLERERALAERAKKIELLRQARLAGPTESKPEPLVFEVVRHRGHWRTLHRKKYSKSYADQVAAVQAAKTLAREKRALGHTVEVRLCRADGQIIVQVIDSEESEQESPVTRRKARRPA
jgi:hypothetical protein